MSSLRDTESLYPELLLNMLVMQFSSAGWTTLFPTSKTVPPWNTKMSNSGWLFTEMALLCTSSSYRPKLDSFEEFDGWDWKSFACGLSKSPLVFDLLLAMSSAGIKSIEPHLWLNRFKLLSSISVGIVKKYILLKRQSTCSLTYVWKFV